MQLRRTKNRWTRCGGTALIVGFLSLAGCGGGGGDLLGQGDNPKPARAFASAALVDTSGRNVGFAGFTEDSAGVVTLHVSVTGLPPGSHGIHIHAVGIADPAATPPFSTAGEHYNPTVHEHGLNNPNGPHAGDLPNLIVDAQGSGTLDVTLSRFTLTPGPATLFDADGSALIIHASQDDQVSNPAGNSGGRIAGGVITFTPNLPG